MLKRRSRLSQATTGGINGMTAEAAVNPHSVDSYSSQGHDASEAYAQDYMNSYSGAETFPLDNSDFQENADLHLTDFCKSLPRIKSLRLARQIGAEDPPTSSRRSSIPSGNAMFHCTPNSAAGSSATFGSGTNSDGFDVFSQKFGSGYDQCSEAATSDSTNASIFSMSSLLSDLPTTPSYHQISPTPHLNPPCASGMNSGFPQDLFGNDTSDSEVGSYEPRSTNTWHGSPIGHMGRPSLRKGATLKDYDGPRVGHSPSNAGIQAGRDGATLDKRTSKLSMNQSPQTKPKLVKQSK